MNLPETSELSMNIFHFEAWDKIMGVPFRSKLIGESGRQTEFLASILRAMCVVLASVAIALFVPGIIALRDKVFYDNDVRLKVLALTDPASNPQMGFGDQKGKLLAYEQQRKRLNDGIASLQQQIDSFNNVSQKEELDFFVHLLNQRNQELASLRPPIFTIGFYLSPQMLLWPAIYSSLGCLLYCFRSPIYTSARKTGKLAVLALGGLFIYSMNGLFG